MIQPPRDLRESRRMLRKYLPAALAATGPVLAVLAGAALDPLAPPAPASAHIIEADAAQPVEPARATTPPQSAAQRYASTVTHRPIAESPFNHPIVHRPEPAKPIAAHAPQPAREPAAEFKLSTIMGGRQTIAVINNKVRRVGDDVGQGWIIQSIDREAGVVTLKHPRDGTQRLTLKPSSASQPQPAAPSSRPQPARSR